MHNEDRSHIISLAGEADRAPLTWKCVILNSSARLIHPTRSQKCFKNVRLTSSNRHVTQWWPSRAIGKELGKQFLSQSIPHLSLPNFLRPDIAESWYDELCRSSYDEKFLHLSHKSPHSWPQRFEGTVSGRYRVLKEEGLVVSHLIRSIFTSVYCWNILKRSLGRPFLLLIREVIISGWT